MLFRSTAGVALGVVLAGEGLKLEAREELQKLAENAGYSIHGGDSFTGRSQFLDGNLSEPAREEAPPDRYTSRAWQKSNLHGSGTSPAQQPPCSTKGRKLKLRAAVDETLSSRMPVGASAGFTAQVGAERALDDLAHEEERLGKAHIDRLLRESAGVVSKAAIRLGIPQIGRASWRERVYL